jgi:Fe2+ transport system protein B
MYLMFQMVYTLGKPLQDGLNLGVEWFKTAALEPLLGGLAQFPRDLLIEGIYGGVGTVAAFIPVIWIFFIGLAVIYATKQDAGLAVTIAKEIDWVQGYSLMLFTLLYVPCLSTVAVIKAESKSVKFALLSVVWSIGLAWVVSFLFYQGARGLGF